MAQWHHQLNGMSWSKLWEIVKDRELWHAAVHGAAKSGTRLSKLNNNKDIYILCNLPKVLNLKINNKDLT